MIWVGVLPDFGENAPVIKANEAMALATFEAYEVANGQGLHLALLVGRTGDYAGGSFEQTPDFRAAVVILPA